jgi:tetratricopeptide (TPR) repeat protein
MEIILLTAVLLIIIVIYKVLGNSSPKREITDQEPGPSVTSVTKVNLMVGDAHPPGGYLFYADGRVGRAPDTAEAHNKWIVQKMTFKIQQEPEDEEWYFERGKALMALHQYAEAIPDFSKLIEFYPSWGETYQFRGLCYYGVGDKEQAVADLRKYKELEVSKPLNPETIKLLDELENGSS